MQIGELATRTGLAPSRIRFYEKNGLLGAVARQDNGYRHYGPQALWRLEIIAGAQRAGFSLDEIRSLLPDTQSHWQHQALVERLQHKVADIERMQQRLALSKAQLLQAIDSVQNPPQDLACAERPQWVLQQLRSHEHTGVGADACVDVGAGAAERDPGQGAQQAARHSPRPRRAKV